MKILIVLLAGLAGCATIVHGSRQDVFVKSEPSGAVVRVGATATKTPGFLTLDRKQSIYVLVFEKEGYKPIEVELRRKMDSWFFGNIIIGGIIGIVIDFTNGSAYKLIPSEVNVVFGETGVSSIRRFKKGDVAIFVDMEQIKALGITPTHRIM